MRAGPSRHPLLTSCDANPKVRVRSCSSIFSSHRVGVYPNVDAWGHDDNRSNQIHARAPNQPGLQFHTFVQYRGWRIRKTILFPAGVL